MTASKEFSLPAYCSKPFPARDSDLALTLVWAGEILHGIKSWQAVEVWMAIKSRATLCYWNIPEVGVPQCRQHSQAAQLEAKEKLKRTKWHHITSPPHPSFGLPKRQHPTGYICLCQGLYLPTSYIHWRGIWRASYGLLSTKHFLLWKDEGFIGRSRQATAVTTWAHLLPYYTRCTSFS